MTQSNPIARIALETGIEHHRRGRLSDAEAEYRRALDLDPHYADALNNLGMLALQTRGGGLALEYLRHAVALKPNDADIHNNIGEAYRSLADLENAAVAYRRALQLQPAHVGAHCNLGSILQQQGFLEEAFSSYQTALAIAPNSAETLNNLGNLYKAQGKVEQAIDCYEKALRLAPASPQAHNNLGIALKDVGLHGEAIANFRESLRLLPGNARTWSNLLLTMLYSPEHDGEAIFAQSREFSRIFEKPLRPTIKVHVNDRDPERRLRIGYVSPDFRRHPVASFIEPVLAGHRQGQIEVLCFHDSPLSDDVTSRLKTRASVWRDISRESDESAAELVRKDRVDILVDLAGHTGHNRMLMFARKPAPLQVTYLGYLGTTGLDAVDYRVADWYTDPAGSEELNSERLLRLPDSLWCYRPLADAPDVSPLPALTNGYVTFGSLNNSAKLNREVIKLWSQILSKIPSARLLVAAVPPGNAAERFKALFASHGILPERLHLLDRVPAGEYAELPSRIDIALDPFPFNGGTTTCELLWAGVPVVTLAGRTFAGRAGVSLLTNVGLPELIADTHDEYVAIARRLANNGPHLVTLRTDLRRRMAASPLMDESRFVRNLEAGYRQCWREWCN